MKAESKVVGIYSNQQELSRSIEHQSFLLTRQLQVFNFFNEEIQRSVRALSKESALFLWSQLLFDVLKKLPHNETAKKDMIEQCVTYYESNEIELAKIEEFRQSYERSKAIEWFTMDSFIYRLVNRAIRMEDMQLIYLFRFIIIDLCCELEIERKAMMERKQGVFTVYRGQQIPNREFILMKNSVGQLFSANGFISTSEDINVARTFIFGATNTNLFTTVMFEITVPSDNLTSVIFADIAQRSRMPDEREILFSLGAVFRIDKVEDELGSGMGKIYLTVTDEGAAAIEQYKRWISQQLIDNNIEILFGNVLAMSGKRRQAETYFTMLLNTLQGIVK